MSLKNSTFDRHDLSCGLETVANGTIISEIDAVFASKPIASGSQASNVPIQKKQKNKNKRPDPNHELQTEDKLKSSKRHQHESSEKSKPVEVNSARKKKKQKDRDGDCRVDGDGVEEVFDPSVAIVQSSSLPQTSIGSSAPSTSKRKIELDEEELAFRDSRGTRQFT